MNSTKIVTIVKTEVVTCPRCGNATIKTKDWGQAGMLFVHAERVERGIPVQDACQVSRDELTNGLKWTTPQ